MRPRTMRGAGQRSGSPETSPAARVRAVAPQVLIPARRVVRYLGDVLRLELTSTRGFPATRSARADRLRRVSSPVRRDVPRAGRARPLRVWRAADRRASDTARTATHALQRVRRIARAGRRGVCLLRGRDHSRRAQARRALSNVLRAHACGRTLLHGMWCRDRTASTFGDRGRCAVPALRMRLAV